MSTLVTDKDIEGALAILSDETGAAVRASHDFMTELSKSVLAKLKSECNEKTASAKEDWARCQPMYTDHLKKVQHFAEESYRWRQRYAAASAKIELYRTLSANNRRLDRL